MRRLLVLLALVASLSVAATPVLAADTYHYRERGSSVDAYFSNVVWDDEGFPVPGSYTETYIYAASWLARGDESWSGDFVCIDSWSFTVDESREWMEDGFVSACGETAEFSLDRKLRSGRVVAAFPAEMCTAWDDWTGECLEWEPLGDVTVDLTFAGAGPLYRFHSNGSYGSAGIWQSTYHGNGVERVADPTGVVALDDVSLIDGATSASGWLRITRSGYVDVWICPPGKGC